MKSLIVAGALAALLPSFALAQNMTCADYLKADAEMTKQMGANAPKMDAEAAALDKKMKDYCTKNPSHTVDKAMEASMK
jgi:hypothetical protein